MAVDATQNIIVDYTFQGDYLTNNIIHIYDYDTNELVYTRPILSSDGKPVKYNDDKDSFTIPADTLTNGHSYVIQMCMSQLTLDGSDFLCDMPVFGGKVEAASGDDSIYIKKGITSIYPWNYNDGAYEPDEVDNTQITNMVIKINGESHNIVSYQPNEEGDYGIIELDAPFTFTVTGGMSYEIYSNFYITPQYYFITNTTPVVTLSNTRYSNRINVAGTYSQEQNIMIKKYNLKLYWSNNAWFSDTSGSAEDSGFRTKLIETTGDIYSQNIKYTFWNPYFHYESQGLKDAVLDLRTIREEIVEKHIDIDQTVYGNIDTNNRELLVWTDENLTTYAEAIESWGYSPEELAGTISTVMGASAEYDGVEIAFSPILQTDNGAVLLDEATVSTYIATLLDNLGSEWDKEDLLDLDTQGMYFSGYIVKNLIADAGITAIHTGEAMHYTGTYGALNLAVKEVESLSKDYYKIVCECTTQNDVVKTSESIIEIVPSDYSDATNSSSHYRGNRLYEFNVWWGKDKGIAYYNLRGYGSGGYHPLGTYELFREDLESGEIIKLPHNIFSTGDSIYTGYDVTASTHGKYRYTLAKFDENGGIIIPVPDETYSGDTVFPSATIEINEGSYYITELNAFRFNDASIHPNEKARQIQNFRTGDTWQFMCDVENTTVVNNLDRMIHVGYSKYISSTSTKVNYMSGSLSATLGRINCAEKQFIDTIATVRAWREFITQPKVFLLKSQKGDVWMVNVTDNPQTTYDETHHSIPTTFTFSWAECMDVLDAYISNYDN